MKVTKVTHEKLMRLAIGLAKKAGGRTNPNPLVGAVVVKKGRVIASGYHQQAGLAHAEVIALNRAGKAARGATLYVNLEPCCHFGRTGPCVDKILTAGIKEVVLAMRDPNPLNNGKGARFLRRHGVKVLSGILAKEAQEINQVFVKYITRKLPFVTVKVAQSLDGKIATVSGDSRGITQSTAHQWVHCLRSQVDAILVGINTVIKDDPLLSCRVNGKLTQRQPKKVIVDSSLRLSPKAKIFASRSPGQVVIATTKLASRRKMMYFQQKGAQVMVIKNQGRWVDLRDLLKKLAQQEITHVLIEGGGEIIASALKMNLVDRMLVLIAPKIIGGRDAPTAVEGKGVNRIKDAQQFEKMQLTKLGADILIEARLR